MTQPAWIFICACVSFHSTTSVQEVRAELNDSFFFCRRLSFAFPLVSALTPAFVRLLPNEQTIREARQRTTPNTFRSVFLAWVHWIRIESLKDDKESLPKLKRTHISKLINFTKAFSRIKFVSEPKTMLLFCKHGKLNQSRIPLFCINKKSNGFPASTSFWTQSYTNSC